MSEEETLKRAIQQIDSLWTTYRGLGDHSMWQGVPKWALDAVTDAARKQLQPQLPWMPIDAWLEGRSE